MIRSLVKGNVGHDENTNTHVNWITEFMAVADDPVVRDYSVIKQFQYLESPLKKISPGKYDFLKKVFSKDSNALSKIDKAENDIKRKRESLRSGCKTKGEFLFIYISYNFEMYTFVSIEMYIAFYNIYVPDNIGNLTNNMLEDTWL